jgi:hypothetical protein
MLVNKLLTEQEPPNRRGDDRCLPFRSEGSLEASWVEAFRPLATTQTFKQSADVTAKKGAERVGAYQPWLGPRMIRIQRCPKTPAATLDVQHLLPVAADVGVYSHDGFLCTAEV